MSNESIADMRIYVQQNFDGINDFHFVNKVYYLFIHVDPAHSQSLLFNWHEILVGSLCATFHKKYSGLLC